MYNIFTNLLQYLKFIKLVLFQYMKKTLFTKISSLFKVHTDDIKYCKKICITTKNNKIFLKKIILLTLKRRKYQ